MRILLFLLLQCMAVLAYSQQTRVYYLESKMDGRIDFASEMGPIRDLPFWGFGVPSLIVPTEITLPAPHIEANEGDSVHVYLFNPSDEGHTIHFHGLDVNQDNDGVPATSRFVLHQEAAWYKFKATHAGNYLYHCHVTTTMHLILGMYGTVTIYPSDSSKHAYENYASYSKSYNYLAAELDSRWNRDYTSIGSFLNYDPDIFAINGKAYTDIYQDSSMVIQADSSDTVLLRLRNIGYGPQEYYFPEELNAEVVGSDGRKFEPSIEMDQLRLYPGERYSVLLHFKSNDSSAVKIDYLNSNSLKRRGSEYLPINSFNFQKPEEPEEPESIAEKTATGFKLYPNPSSGKLHIELPNSGENDFISIYSSRNQLLLSVPFQKELDLGSLSKGIYWMNIPGRGTEKFVIAR